MCVLPGADRLRTLILGWLPFFTEKFKDENWNLEYQIQELQSKLTEAQADRQRTDAEHKRTLKQLTSAREVADGQKNEAERLQSTVEELKAKHETDIAQMRKTVAGLQREKGDLQTTVDGLKAEMAQKARTAPKFSLPGTPIDGYHDPLLDDDVFTGTGSRRKLDNQSLATPGEADDFEGSPESSPSKPVPSTPLHSTELESLRQSLAHAHRQMSNLKNSVQREKDSKRELQRRLAQETSSSADWEDQDNAETSPASARNRFHAVRATRGQTPRRKPMTLAQKLGMAAAERRLDGHEFTESATMDEWEDQEPSPFIESAPSRPTSVDGMDPAFANILRSLPSHSTLDGNSQSPSPDNKPRRRGGAAFGTEPRPTSLVDVSQGNALSAELGGGPYDDQGLALDDYGLENSEDLFDETAYGYPSRAETVEVGIQCEPEPVESLLLDTTIQVEPTLSEPAPLRVFVDTEVQCDPEPEPEIERPASPIPLPLVTTAEIAVQASVEPTTSISSSAQTDIPIMTSASTFTEPELISQRADASTTTEAILTLEASVQTIDEVMVPTTSEISEVLSYTVPVPSIVQPQDHLLASTSTVAVPRHSFIGRPMSIRPVAMLFDDETDTETEAEYVDARETEPTPSSSVQEFQSFQNTDESDAESVRTSIASTPFPRGSTTPIGRRSRYNSVATNRTVQVPRPETKEVSIQTDEWVPPPSQSPPQMVNFQRSGSSQPFTFIPSPIKASGSNSLSLAIAASIVRSPIRETTNTLGRTRASSLLSEGEMAKADLTLGSEDLTSSSIMSMVDRTRPPQISLPPPPSMPPPAMVPVKKSSIPPPRPTSPVPPELLQRATTPTFSRQSSLMVPSNRPPRSSLSSQTGQGSLPSSLRQPLSNASIRSVNGGIRGTFRSGPPPPTFVDPTDDRRFMSQTSLVSQSSAPRSRRPSITSSRSSEKGLPASTNPGTPQTPGSNGPGSSADPSVIHAITQTMIGEFLFKYTRRVVGKGHGEKRHKRFFWVHPYTKTLYWSSADPGASNAGESNAKSGERHFSALGSFNESDSRGYIAYIDGVKQIVDPNPMPPGLHQYSIIVYTPQREMKFTAPTKERHDIWFKVRFSRIAL